MNSSVVFAVVKAVNILSLVLFEYLLFLFFYFKVQVL